MPLARFLLVLAGDASSGKKTWGYRAAGAVLDVYDPTGPHEPEIYHQIDDTVFCVDPKPLLDLPEYAAINEQFMRDAEGFLIVYSVGDRMTFSHVRQYFKALADVDAEMNRQVTPLCLVGNRIDLPESERQVSPEEGKALANELGCGFFEISTKDDIRTKEPLDYVLRDFMRRKESGESKALDGGIKVKSEPRRRGWRRSLLQVFRR